ncbi:NAD(P)-dependent alcohol dehydrogenase [Herpetosiphon geysericola]|uniref:Hydroxyacid dehydrogenase n=1 Tax=Herpetosiphon geysericola TaxID=70996 RepID=A0A0P6YEQ1_9CHLR|nr:NAD(P)-dependent alcohol dehydrogenase [Herpetosiphon geysericola]KPL90649.1 hydroxyacid dehydrogenase [Herpetosiphon geysericola]
MLKTQAYAAFNHVAPFAPFEFERRDLTPTDVQIEILYCGICHSDLHQARSEWDGTVYPIVPGHEIVGRVLAVGSEVRKFQVGDTVGVGCMVDSCGQCADCHDQQEQFCPKTTYTYNSPDAHTGGVTYGGYSSQIVVTENFVLRIADHLDLARVAPLLCAGITTYSPLRHWNVQPGQKVGVVGLGGLGHIGVKIAKAMGAEVVLFTTSAHKAADAERLGATVVISKDPAAMRSQRNSFDFILNTVSASHNLDDYLNLLKRDGTLCLVGVPENPHPTPSYPNLIFRRRQLSGSLIGGIAETQEMLDFCAEHNILADIELIGVQQIDQAYDRMLKSDVKYRFVIDLASLKAE